MDLLIIQYETQTVLLI